MYAKGIDKWQKRPTQDRRKWAELSYHMIEYYERQFTDMVGTTMGQEGYGTSMNATEDLADGDSLTEAVTKYAERATQAKSCMAQMEIKFEEIQKITSAFH